MEIQKNDNVTERPGQPEQKTASVTAPAFNIGSVLSRTFGLLAKKPATFFGLMLLAALPSFLLTLAIYASGTLEAAILPKIVELVLGIAIQGAIAYVVFQTLRGNDVSLGESIKRGMARLVPLAIVALLVGIGTGLGFALLIIPGLILMCLWYVTVPACVVERLGPVESMSRSAQLTSGHRWSIFGLVLIVFLATILLYFVVVGLASLGGVFAAAVLALVGFVLPQTFGNVMVAIVYFDLRNAKDGISVDSLVNVFD